MHLMHVPDRIAYEPTVTLPNEEVSGSYGQRGLGNPVNLQPTHRLM